MLSAPGGGWFAAVGSGATDEAGHGFYHRGVLRLSSDGRRLWGGGDFFEPGTARDAARLRHTSLAVLADSVLLATALPNETPLNADDVTLSPEHPLATLVRYSLKGDRAQALELGAVEASLAIEPRAAVFLLSDPSEPQRYDLERIDFSALDEPLAKSGEACSVSEDCASGACCAKASGLFAVTCGDNVKCATGNYCTADEQCDGTCLISPSGAGQGYCTPVCMASSDCPSSHACIAGECRQVCLSTEDCPYRGTECSQATSAEALVLGVCTAVAL